MTQWTYFAKDGSYGDASELVIINTTDWTDYNWETIAIGTGADDFTTLAEKVAFDNNSYIIYGDEVAVETPDTTANAHITPKGKAFLAGLASGLSTQDAIVYANNIVLDGDAR